MDSTELLFKLLHHRSFRQVYLPTSDFDEDQKEQLTTASAQVVLQTLKQVKVFYPDCLKNWENVFPQDSECFELIYLFLESDDFLNVHNLAFDESSRSQRFCFYNFLNKKLPVSEKFSSIREALNREFNKGSLFPRDLTF